MMQSNCYVQANLIEIFIMACLVAAISATQFIKIDIKGSLRSHGMSVPSCKVKNKVASASYAFSTILCVRQAILTGHSNNQLQAL